ncbi:MAG: heme-binding protein [Rhodobacteraceae bacterium]|nr:heme-binding protein [Paracoccaceae bacterium]
MIVAVLAMALSVHATADTYRGYEMPPYRVVDTAGAFELRAYAPHLVAEVDVDGTRGQSIRRGFRSLARFIFGQNDSGAEVPMTVPVSQIPNHDGQWTVRFLMPSAFTLQTLPEPTDPDIRFIETDAVEHLVLRFAGRASTRDLAAQAQKLLGEAAARGLRVDGAVHYHFYDDPFTLPRNRRNEVSVPVS